MQATTAPTTTLNITTTHRAETQWTKACIIHSAHFPESGANTVHQSGRALSEWSKGLTVNIYQRDGRDPHAWEVYTDNEQEYGEGSLGFFTKVLEDYDGCFCLPTEVMDVLDALGYDTQSMRESLE
jgi:hypothetical protein